MRLPEAVLSERDAAFYQARMQGHSFRVIAKANNVSVGTAHAGFIRHQKRQAKLGAAASKDAVWLALDQYDALIAQLWPMTRTRKIQIDTEDGMREIEVGPSMDAVDRVHKLLASKHKILGLEKDVLQLTVGGDSGPGLGSSKDAIEATPEVMAKEFAAELIKHRVIAGPLVETIEKMLSTANRGDIIEAEVIEDTQDQLAIGSGEENIPPAWIDDDEDEYIPGSWIPDDMDDGETE